MNNFFERMADRVLGLESVVDPAPQSNVPLADEADEGELERDRFWEDREPDQPAQEPRDPERPDEPSGDSEDISEPDEDSGPAEEEQNHLPSGVPQDLDAAADEAPCIDELALPFSEDKADVAAFEQEGSDLDEGLLPHTDETTDETQKKTVDAEESSPEEYLPIGDQFPKSSGDFDRVPEIDPSEKSTTSRELTSAEPEHAMGEAPSPDNNANKASPPVEDNTNGEMEKQGQSRPIDSELGKPTQSKNSVRNEGLPKAREARIVEEAPNPDNRNSTLAGGGNGQDTRGHGQQKTAKKGTEPVEALAPPHSKQNFQSQNDTSTEEETAHPAQPVAHKHSLETETRSLAAEAQKAGHITEAGEPAQTLAPTRPEPLIKKNEQAELPTTLETNSPGLTPQRVDLDQTHPKRKNRPEETGRVSQAWPDADPSRSEVSQNEPTGFEQTSALEKATRTAPRHTGYHEENASKPTRLDSSNTFPEMSLSVPGPPKARSRRRLVPSEDDGIGFTTRFEEPTIPASEAQTEKSTSPRPAPSLRKRQSPTAPEEPKRQTPAPQVRTESTDSEARKAGKSQALPQHLDRRQESKPDKRKRQDPIRSEERQALENPVRQSRSDPLTTRAKSEAPAATNQTEHGKAQTAPVPGKTFLADQPDKGKVSLDKELTRPVPVSREKQRAATPDPSAEPTNQTKQAQTLSEEGQQREPNKSLVAKDRKVAENNGFAEHQSQKTSESKPATPLETLANARPDRTRSEPVRQKPHEPKTAQEARKDPEHATRKTVRAERSEPTVENATASAQAETTSHEPGVERRAEPEKGERRSEPVAQQPSAVSPKSKREPAIQSPMPQVRREVGNRSQNTTVLDSGFESLDPLPIAARQENEAERTTQSPLPRKRKETQAPADHNGPRSTPPAEGDGGFQTVIETPILPSSKEKGKNGSEPLAQQPPATNDKNRAEPAEQSLAAQALGERRSLDPSSARPKPRRADESIDARQIDPETSVRSESQETGTARAELQPSGQPPVTSTQAPLPQESRKRRRVKDPSAHTRPRQTSPAEGEDGFRTVTETPIIPPSKEKGESQSEPAVEQPPAVSHENRTEPAEQSPTSLAGQELREGRSLDPSARAKPQQTASDERIGFQTETPAMPETQETGTARTELQPSDQPPATSTQAPLPQEARKRRRALDSSAHTRPRQTSPDDGEGGFQTITETPIMPGSKVKGESRPEPTVHQPLAASHENRAEPAKQPPAPVAAQELREGRSLEPSARTKPPQTDKGIDAFQTDSEAPVRSETQETGTARTELQPSDQPPTTSNQPPLPQEARKRRKVLDFSAYNRPRQTSPAEGEGGFHTVTETPVMPGSKEKGESRSVPAAQQPPAASHKNIAEPAKQPPAPLAAQKPQAGRSLDPSARAKPLQTASDESIGFQTKNPTMTETQETGTARTELQPSDQPPVTSTQAPPQEAGKRRRLLDPSAHNRPQQTSPAEGEAGFETVSDTPVIPRSKEKGESRSEPAVRQPLAASHENRAEPLKQPPAPLAAQEPEKRRNLDPSASAKPQQTASYESIGFQSETSAKSKTQKTGTARIESQPSDQRPITATQPPLPQEARQRRRVLDPSATDRPRQTSPTEAEDRLQTAIETPVIPRSKEEGESRSEPAVRQPLAASPENRAEPVKQPPEPLAIQEPQNRRNLEPPTRIQPRQTDRAIDAFQTPARQEIEETGNARSQPSDQRPLTSTQSPLPQEAQKRRSGLDPSATVRPLQTSPAEGEDRFQTATETPVFPSSKEEGESRSEPSIKQPPTASHENRVEPAKQPPAAQEFRERRNLEPSARTQPRQTDQVDAFQTDSQTPARTESQPRDQRPITSTQPPLHQEARKQRRVLDPSGTDRPQQTSPAEGRDGFQTGTETPIFSNTKRTAGNRSETLLQQPPPSGHEKKAEPAPQRQMPQTAHEESKRQMGASTHAKPRQASADEGHPTFQPVGAPPAKPVAQEPKTVRSGAKRADQLPVADRRETVIAPMDTFSKQHGASQEKAPESRSLASNKKRDISAPLASRAVAPKPVNLSKQFHKMHASADSETIAERSKGKPNTQKQQTVQPLATSQNIVEQPPRENVTAKALTDKQPASSNQDRSRPDDKSSNHVHRTERKPLVHAKPADQEQRTSQNLTDSPLAQSASREAGTLPQPALSTARLEKKPVAFDRTAPHSSVSDVSESPHLSQEPVKRPSLSRRERAERETNSKVPSSPSGKPTFEDRPRPASLKDANASTPNHERPASARPVSALSPREKAIPEPTPFPETSPQPQIRNKKAMSPTALPKANSPSSKRALPGSVPAHGKAETAQTQVTLPPKPPATPVHSLDQTDAPLPALSETKNEHLSNQTSRVATRSEAPVPSALAKPLEKLGPNRALPSPLSKQERSEPSQQRDESRENKPATPAEGYRKRSSASSLPQPGQSSKSTTSPQTTATPSEPHALEPATQARTTRIVKEPIKSQGPGRHDSAPENARQAAQRAQQNTEPQKAMTTAGNLRSPAKAPIVRPEAPTSRQNSVDRTEKQQKRVVTRDQAQITHAATQSPPEVFDESPKWEGKPKATANPTTREMRPTQLVEPEVDARPLKTEETAQQKQAATTKTKKQEGTNHSPANGMKPLLKRAGSDAPTWGSTPTNAAKAPDQGRPRISREVKPARPELAKNTARSLQDAKAQEMEPLTRKDARLPHSAPNPKPSRRRYQENQPQGPADKSAHGQKQRDLGHVLPTARRKGQVKKNVAPLSPDRLSQASEKQGLERQAHTPAPKPIERLVQEEKSGTGSNPQPSLGQQPDRARAQQLKRQAKRHGKPLPRTPFHTAEPIPVPTSRLERENRPSAKPVRAPVNQPEIAGTPRPLDGKTTPKYYADLKVEPTSQATNPKPTMPDKPATEKTTVLKPTGPKTNTGKARPAKKANLAPTSVKQQQPIPSEKRDTTDVSISFGRENRAGQARTTKQRTDSGQQPIAVPREKPAMAEPDIQPQTKATLTTKKSRPTREAAPLASRSSQHQQLSAAQKRTSARRAFFEEGETGLEHLVDSDRVPTRQAQGEKPIEAQVKMTTPAARKTTKLEPKIQSVQPGSEPQVSPLKAPIKGEQGPDVPPALETPQPTGVNLNVPTNPIFGFSRQASTPGSTAARRPILARPAIAKPSRYLGWSGGTFSQPLSPEKQPGQEPSRAYPVSSRVIQRAEAPPIPESPPTESFAQETMPTDPAPSPEVVAPLEEDWSNPFEPEVKADTFRHAPDRAMDPAPREQTRPVSEKDDFALTIPITRSKPPTRADARNANQLDVRVGQVKVAAKKPEKPAPRIIEKVYHVGSSQSLEEFLGRRG